MNIKLVLICAVFFVEVNTECGDYLACLSELIHGFFGTKPRNSTVQDNFNQTNETDLYEIRDFNDKHLDRILTQVSSIVQNNITGDIKDAKLKTAEFMNDKTKVLIKIFDFGTRKTDTVTEKTEEETITTEKEQIFVTLPSTTETSEQHSSTENVKDTFLTTDIINQVNNMAVSFDNFEDNLIVPENYLDVGDNNTDYPNIDYIELYKDATLENVEFIPTPISDIVDDQIGKDIDNNLIEYSAAEEKHSNTLNKNDSGIPAAVYPWIATIFIKNYSKENQFEYYCDGALLNDRFVLTAGRCINTNNVTVKADNILVVLGKKSLHSAGEDEKVHKVKTIKTHENFTINDTGADNDLAVLELDEPTVNSDGYIKPAHLIEDDSDIEDSATTAWGFNGELTEIIFDKEASRKFQKSESENTFCATYGNGVALCPSYGGLHVVKQTDRWSLNGIRTGDPEQRGICLNRDVTFTNLEQYRDWINDTIA